MIQSMTGFGRSEKETKEYKITVEMKSVNHRYCDFGIKLPKKISFLESNIRMLLKQSISRGKLDLFITYEDYKENTKCVMYKSDIASQYLEHFKKMADEFDIENDITVSKLAHFPDVFALEEQIVDEEEIWTALESVLLEGVEQLIKARQKEGEALKTDLLNKLQDMELELEEIEKQAPLLLEQYKKKLEEKVKELMGQKDIDDNRIAMEVILYADKTCIDEEVVRLKSHIATMKETLSSEENSIGRKLDFIAQEMNREANTILSKANDVTISNRGITLKTEIEKIREQIQNIE